MQRRFRMTQGRSLANLRRPLSAPEVSEARFKRFQKDLAAYEDKLTFERTMDAMLDLYSSWKRTRDSALKLRLVMLAFELRRLDPGFEFDLTFDDKSNTWFGGRVKSASK